jgi:phosphoribosyl 1,2-cyclic phosphodiesterase
MTMTLKFLGVRGSRPTHKRHLLGYGGNSTSLEFCVGGENFYLFLDGGSGLAWRGSQITARDPSQKPPGKGTKFHFLVTHTHWDHILGYPFFEPIYNPDNNLIFYASKTTRSTFTDLFFGLQRLTNLPVPISHLKANLTFETIQPDSTFLIEGKVKVSTMQINHQGVTLGYRVEHGDDSVCVITDNAPIENGNVLGENMFAGEVLTNEEKAARFNQRMVDFLKGAHTVVFDTHFTEDNLKPDWGHSTPDRALEYCSAAGVKRLILFHHAPEENDSDVDNKVQSVFTKACQLGIEVVAARENEEWELCA